MLMCFFGAWLRTAVRRIFFLKKTQHISIIIKMAEKFANQPLRTGAATLEEHAEHALAIIHKQELTVSEADQVMAETIQYWKDFVNAGFLKV
jgi:hypothetical protein